MKKLVLSLITVLFIISACSDSSSPSGTNWEFFPLKIGNTWNYQNIYDNDTSFVTFHIKSDTIINYQNWFEFSFDSVSSVYYQNRINGLWTYNSYYFGGDYPSSYLLYKYPAKSNEEYVVERDTVKVVNITQKVEVPAGTFYCYVYQNSSWGSEKTYYHEHFLAPGIGLIKMINYTKKENNVYDTLDITELTSYTLK